MQLPLSTRTRPVKIEDIVGQKLRIRNDDIEKEEKLQY